MNNHVSEIECPHCGKYLHVDSVKKLWMWLLPGSKRLFCPTCHQDYVVLIKSFEGPAITKMRKYTGKAWVFQILFLRSADKSYMNRLENRNIGG